MAMAAMAVFAGNAAADEYHYNTTLIGERPAGMGGAYTAVSDDASGMYYNPAGIVYSPGSNISASVNAFSVYTKQYENAIGNYKYARQSQNFQPNFFGVVQHTPLGTVGFSYAIPDSMLESQDQSMPSPNSALSSYNINFNKEYNLYNVGPSWARDINNDFKFGVTLYYHYKRQKTINNVTQTLLSALSSGAAGQGLWSNVYYKLEELGFRPIVGLVWAPENGKYSVGLALSQTYIYDASQYTQITTNYNSSTLAVANAAPSITRTNTIPQYPIVAKMGVAYFPSNALLFAGDLTYSSQVTADTGAYGWDRKSLINFALGMEYFTSSSFAVRTGVFSDYTNVADLKVARDMVDMYGVSLSGSWFAKSTAITAGFTYGYGSGDSNPADNGTKKLSLQSTMIFIGTSYSY